MVITYDPKKNERNIAERGLSFDLVSELDWESVRVIEDDRQDYGEVRFAVVGLDRSPAAYRGRHPARGRFARHQSEKGKRERGKAL